MATEEKKVEKDTVIHAIDDSHDVVGFTAPVMTVIFVIAILLGTGAGYVAATRGSSATGSKGGSILNIGGSQAAASAGVKDSKKYPDSAEGTMREGGIDGEGNFHLERPGGDSQNVYLTSSIVDLSQYIGRKVLVNGQTFAGNKAGWLMDVGYIEVK